MRLDYLQLGLEILSGYYDDASGSHLRASRGMVYLRKTDRPLSRLDVARLIELGWHQDIEFGASWEDMNPDDYDQEKPWCAEV